MTLMTGIESEALPFILRSCDWVTGIILGCFLLTAYVFGVSKYILIRQVRDFFHTRRRNNLFDQETAGELHCRLLLIFQTCLLVSVLLLHHYGEEGCPPDFARLVPWRLGGYTLLLLFYALFKWGMYRFINWIFFDKIQSNLWIDSYYFIASVCGILLFPLVLLAVYFDLAPFYTDLCGLILFILVNLLLLYKGFCIFFNKIHGVFFLFVYFCTLEMIPLLLLWKGFILVNNVQI